ncbi:hypothetical protein IFM89_002089 [Coptis chinensis]|uniref:Phytosulfokine n=1 Tax=Coptis chinensis TaxID=261450 RepID=A0A835H157_9MAGN|nr:hypothetical protein IFM89_002089 [Coptis chinensis]
MKRSFQFNTFLLLLVLVLLSSAYSTTTATTARFLIPIQGEKEHNVHEFPQKSPVLEIEQEDKSDDLMGMEHCENKDEECINRRMTAEAHLDYIYTQHHKGP